MKSSNKQWKSEPGTQLSFFQCSAIQFVYFGGMAFFLYPSLIVNSTHQAYWLPVFVWMVLGILGSWLYSRLMSMQPGKDIFEMARLQFGTFGCFLVLLPFVIYVFDGIVLMVRAHAEIIAITMLQTTPQWFLNGLLLIPLYAATGGIISIIRISGIFFIISIPLTLVMNGLGMSNLQWELAKPWIAADLDMWSSPEFYASSYVWAGYIYLGVIGKHVKNPKKLWETYVWAGVTFSPLILGAVFLPILTFGPELTRQLTFPYVSKMDSVDQYWLIFSNVTAVFVSTSMIYVISTVALMYYSLGCAIHVLFPRWNKRAIFGVLGVATYTAASLVPSWSWIESAVMWDSWFRLFMMFLFPLLLIMVIGFKKRTGWHE